MRKLLPVLSILIVAACSKQPESSRSSTSSASPVPAAATSAKPTESAVAPEVNPPGDIPDTQQFIKYSSAAGGYELDVPEGWARTESGGDVTFANKIDGLSVRLSSRSTAPTVSSARSEEAKQIQAQGRAAIITGVSSVTLPSGSAVLIKYTSNSEPNAVTSRQIRLENEAYLFFRNGKLATLTLWAPEGADNADQWNRMSKSFRWR